MFEYFKSLDAAAYQLAKTPSAKNNPSLFNEICRSYGIYPQSMANSEKKYFEGLIKSYE